MPPLESALFESGKPVLIVPTQRAEGDRPQCAGLLERLTEQAHTNAFALPLLRLAEKVTVLAAEGAMTPGPTAEQAALHLRRNGVNATAATAPTGARSPGETILDQAASLGCDLLVKSAYTQSRLRQMIFGGATRHILANAELPVLMAH